MKIAVSIGDPNGIGIEAFLKALKKLNIDKKIEFNLYSPKNILNQWYEILNFDANFHNLHNSNYKINIIDFDSDYKLNLGKVDLEAGKIAVKSLDLAFSETINKKNNAILTLPISKESMYMTGWSYTGHTEYFAEKCNIQKQLMILFKDSLRCALVTTHKAIKEVPNFIKQDIILEKIIEFNKSLKYDFAIGNPKIAVLGLNPHSGENGNIGTEEIDEILPAIKKANYMRINCSGAYPSDGFFAHKEFQNFDGYIAMYHDQGLIPLKLLAFGGGVNFTAGLPIIRTSPDHGTAFAIAGKNIATEQSTLDAIYAAIDIYNNHLDSK